MLGLFLGSSRMTCIMGKSEVCGVLSLLSCVHCLIYMVMNMWGLDSGC